MAIDTREVIKYSALSDALTATESATTAANDAATNTTYAGEWDILNDYAKNNSVSYQDSIYICLLTVAAVDEIDITNETYWQLAIQVLVPDRIVSVFASASNEAPYYTDIATALSYINSLTPTRSAPVLLKYFLATATGQDIYALFDSGIIFESPFDYFEKWKQFGGDLTLSELLYDIDLSRINTITL